MKKQVDAGSEFSYSSEDISGELIKVDNCKGDIEKIVLSAFTFILFFTGGVI